MNAGFSFGSTWRLGPLWQALNWLGQRLGSFFSSTDATPVITLGAVFIAAAALWITWKQLRTLAIQTRAQIFLTLDERWEHDPLLAIRGELEAKVDEWSQEALATWNQTSGEAFETYLLTVYADKLDSLASAETSTYRRLFLVCGFFETVGFTARTEHVPVEHVVSLFGGSILFQGRVFGEHIRRLLAQPDADPRQYEHFLWLVNRAERQFKR